ncbi:NAD-dependent dehydratase [Enterococcus saigonensis]|uniref:NAD-dependent dehydratase n=1 Tax=Enterococcus saigonensis TaxID=1805431 RepID=A0A679I940_9ENTE|nr:NAD(P)H-binding protein [Enterococcus saigonensis]BCA84900.1 NAD-dependent dehydratase [Enterococcus saigonensis]
MKILILGANGKIAQLVREMLATKHVSLRLFLRNASRIENIGDNEEVIEGDATNFAAITRALTDVDIVYANLAGQNIEAQAKNIVRAMTTANKKRIIWISTLGIYDEVPGDFGKWNHEMLDGGYLETYAAAANVIETSPLNYTIIRPAWLTNQDEVNFELTQKGELFNGTEVSRKSVATLVTEIINNPTRYTNQSIGINKPGTDGPMPAWY